MVRLIEDAVGRQAIREYLPMQPGDVLETCADCTDLEGAVGFRPNTPLKEGIRLFVEWFQAFHAAPPARRRAFDFYRATGQALRPIINRQIGPFTEIMTKAVLGIIGGSGIYDLPGLTNAQSKVIESPWGKPSAALLCGEIDRIAGRLFVAA